jgi:dihydroneopterin aldolase
MERSEYLHYDHLLKNIVATSDDIRKVLKYGISLSTLKEWKKNGSCALVQAILILANRIFSGKA